MRRCEPHDRNDQKEESKRRIEDVGPSHGRPQRGEVVRDGHRGPDTSEFGDASEVRVREVHAPRIPSCRPDEGQTHDRAERRDNQRPGAPRRSLPPPPQRRAIHRMTLLGRTTIDKSRRSAPVTGLSAKTNAYHPPKTMHADNASAVRSRPSRGRAATMTAQARQRT